MSRHLCFHSNDAGRPGLLLRSVGAPMLFAATCAAALPAQSPVPPPAPASSSMERMADIERRLDEVTAALGQTQQALQQSLSEVQRLHAELKAMQPHPEAAAPATAALADPGGMPVDEVTALREQQEALQAEVKQHEQSKLETASRYPVRVSGLILFNAFSNAGVVDNAGLPAIALPRNPGSSHGSAGVLMRQSILGLEGTGPRIFGARSSAQVSVDFFGGTSSNTFGYSTSAGVVRLRQATIGLDWDKTTLQAAVAEPLFSPLSPTSYATVSQPALSASGNLWAWSPQLRVEQRVALTERRRMIFAGGLIDPGSSGYTTTQLVNPVEASRRPGYEGRVAFEADAGGSATPRSFTLGLGGFSSSQFYGSATNIHSWAVSGDWKIPISKAVEITGEVYRGRSLGDFGSGTYKDFISGVDTTTGLTRTRGIDVIGGWSQLKLRFAPGVEANAAFGLDDALSSNFDGLIVSSSTAPFELYARNNSVIGNIIFRPKTYLILSPEYRRVQSWRYTGPANIANIFTITAGYQF